MMCQTIGRFPIGNIGLGRSALASRMRIPCPPQRMTVFIECANYRRCAAVREGDCQTSVDQPVILRSEATKDLWRAGLDASSRRALPRRALRALGILRVR